LFGPGQKGLDMRQGILQFVFYPVRLFVHEEQVRSEIGHRGQNQVGPQLHGFPERCAHGLYGIVPATGAAETGELDIVEPRRDPKAMHHGRSRDDEDQ
jgi:hypothetical protein